MTEKSTILQTVSCINLSTGGPAVSVPKLAQGISHHGFESRLFSNDYAELGPMNELEGVEYYSEPLSNLSKKLRGFSSESCSKLLNAAEGCSIIHNHGLWMAPNTYARKAAQKYSVPLVISPRGMLAQWSLNHRWLKKKIAWHLYESKNMKACDVFHATSWQEAEGIRELDYKTPIAVIPNGVDLPEHETNAPRELLEQYHPELRQKNWILFLSRLHEKKGIDDLIQSWSSITQEYPDWHLVLAGQDLTGHTSAVENQILKHETGRSITLTGELKGKERIAALSNCEVLVLPSHSENFGLVVAEALSYEKPVITTQGTPWRELEESGCGWWIQKSTENLCWALRQALQLSPEERHTMGQRGYQLVRDRYTWNSVAERMAKVYRWILKQDSKPPTVI